MLKEAGDFLWVPAYFENPVLFDWFQMFKDMGSNSAQSVHCWFSSMVLKVTDHRDPYHQPGKYYKNHQTVKWARIFVSLPHSLSSTALPTFIDGFQEFTAHTYTAVCAVWNCNSVDRSQLNFTACEFEQDG